MKEGKLPPRPGETSQLMPAASSGIIPNVRIDYGDFPIIVDVEGTMISMKSPDALALAGRIIATVECWERYRNG